MSLRRFEIGFDEKAVNDDGIYEIHKLYHAIDEVMKMSGINKISEGTYECIGDDAEVQKKFDIMFFLFCSEKWFLKYVNKWLAYHDNYEPEDIIEIMEKVNKTYENW